MRLDKLKIDTSRREAGDWAPPVPGLDGVRFKVRARNARVVRRAREKILARRPPEERLLPLTVEASDAVEAELMATAVVLDWEGLTEAVDGDETAERPLPFSVERALALFAEPAYAALVGAAGWSADWLEAATAPRLGLEADVGNSAPSSTGS